MGRRALRKIEPELDLSRHLISGEGLSFPCDPQGLFSGPRALEIEVGSGKGLFLRTASAARTDRNFLGIEIAGKYARFAAASLARRGLENARVIHGDAPRCFAAFPSACAVAVHVYFPDPWWKKRHKRRRVMNAAFLKQIERVLANEGELHFWTDVEEYFHLTLELFAEETGLSPPHFPPARPAEHDLDYRTHFERRMRQHGEAVFRAELRKDHRAAGGTSST